MKLYVGIDVSKTQLDIYINDIERKDFRLENSKTGIEALIKILQDLNSKGHTVRLVICEATGGYERTLSLMLRAAGLPIHVAHPNKVRNFAKATGVFAKTDKIDARILSNFAKVFNPKPDEIALSPELEVLRTLSARRQQLLEDKTSEHNRLDKHISDIIRKSIKKHIAWIEKEIDSLEKLISQQIKTHDEIKNAVDLLSSVPGVGDITAAALLTELPELGNLDGKKLASLVGVAPLNRDSGKKRGKRHIRGGRNTIREILYMSALTSIRFNYDMKIFYDRLRENGKEAKVALVAVMRKLIMLLNEIARRKTPWEDRQALGVMV